MPCSGSAVRGVALPRATAFACGSSFYLGKGPDVLQQLARRRPYRGRETPEYVHCLPSRSVAAVALHLGHARSRGAAPRPLLRDCEAHRRLCRQRCSPNGTCKGILRAFALAVGVNLSCPREPASPPPRWARHGLVRHQSWAVTSPGDGARRTAARGVGGGHWGRRRFASL